MRQPKHNRGFVLASSLLCACSAQLDPGTCHTPGATTPDASMGGTQIGNTPDAGSPLDSAPPLGNWTTPTRIPGTASAGAIVDDCTLDSTGTELYFAAPDPSITGSPKQLWMMTRATTNDPWGGLRKLAELNTAEQNESPRLSPDDGILTFGRNGDIYAAMRTATGWGTPINFAPVNTTGYEKWLAVCSGGYFMITRANGMQLDLYDGVLGQTTGDPVTTLNSTGNESSTYLSPDCLTVYFASTRSGTMQMYTAQRASITDAWPAPTMVTDFGMSTDNEDAYLSPDQRLFVFASVRDGSAAGDKALYISTR